MLKPHYCIQVEGKGYYYNYTMRYSQMHLTGWRECNLNKTRVRAFYYHLVPNQISRGPSTLISKKMTVNFVHLKVCLQICSRRIKLKLLTLNIQLVDWFTTCSRQLNSHFRQFIHLQGLCTLASLYFHTQRLCDQRENSVTVIILYQSKNVQNAIIEQLFTTERESKCYLPTI